MNSSQQKLIIDTILSSGVVYSRCAGILDGEYFDPEYRKVINYIKEYADKYGATPAVDLVNAKFDGLEKEFKTRVVATPEVSSSCDDIERFCKEKALVAAVLASLEDIESGEHAAISERIAKAQLVSLERDLGVDMFADPEGYLLSLVDTDHYYSTGISELDGKLDGGLARKQLTLFSANSGGGKSVMLSNLGANFAMLHGMNVLYISLELAEPMIYKRNSFIMSGASSKEWKEKISFIASKLNAIKRDGAGSYLVKRLPTGSNANVIRAYLKQYELEYGFAPDVIIVDYLDMMSPNEGTKNLSISEQDKFKAEQLSQILHDYNAIGLSASQQNRDALKTNAPDQSVIAGGMTKVNTVDNYISLYMDPGMRIKGEMAAHMLKTRSSDGVGQSVMLGFDTACLRIGDLDQSGMKGHVERMKGRKAAAQEASKNLDRAIEGLPGLGPASPPESKLDKTLDKIENGAKVDKTVSKRDNVADLSGVLKDKGKKGKAKPKSAIELMDEEDAVTSYGKLDTEALPKNNDGKTLPKQTEEFLARHNMSEEAREFVLSFME